MPCAICPSKIRKKKQICGAACFIATEIKFFEDVPLSRPHYHSTAHNIQRILFIFGTANDLSRSMNPIGYDVSMFIFWDLVAL